jgi:hypothetical protein
MHETCSVCEVDDLCIQDFGQKTLLKEKWKDEIEMELREI